MKSYYSYWEIIVSWQTKDVQKLNCVTSTRNLYASHIISCAFNFYFITFLRRTTFLFSFYFFCIHSIHKYFMVNKVKWFSFYFILHFILYMSPLHYFYYYYFLHELNVCSYLHGILRNDFAWKWIKRSDCFFLRLSFLWYCWNIGKKMFDI